MSCGANRLLSLLRAPRGWDCSDAAYGSGTRVDVLYDTHDPSNARINSWLDLWGLAFFFGLMSFFFLGLGLTILVVVAKRTPSIESSASNPAGGS